MMAQRVVMLMPSLQGAAALDALLACGYSTPDNFENTEGLTGVGVAGLVGCDPQIWHKLEAEKLLVVDGPESVVAGLRDLHQGASERDIEITASRLFADAYEYIRSGFTPVTQAALADLSEGVEGLPRYVVANYSGANRIYGQFPQLEGGHATWGPELLIYPDTENASSGPVSIDITGRARIIAYGPYFMLVPGCWRLDAVVEVEPQAGSLDLFFEWGSGEQFERSQYSFNKEGTYSISIDHVWEEAGACEFRLTTTRPHFDGAITIVSMNVTYVAPPDQNPQ